MTDSADWLSRDTRGPVRHVRKQAGALDPADHMERGGWAACVNPDAPRWGGNRAGVGVRGKNCVANIEEIAGVRDGRGDGALPADRHVVVGQSGTGKTVRPLSGPENGRMVMNDEGDVQKPGRRQRGADCGGRAGGGALYSGI